MVGVNRVCVCAEGQVSTCLTANDVLVVGCVWLLTLHLALSRGV